MLNQQPRQRKAARSTWPKTVLFWQRATPTERAEDFRLWVDQLPKTNTTLADEAFDRGSIYE
jgi:hypothetical protein